MQALPQVNVPGANYETGDAGGLTVLLFGHPGSWKSTWSAQWPGVLFLSIAAEGGDDALKVYPEVAQTLMSNSQLQDCPPVFNTSRPPRILIKGAQQFANEVDKIVANHKKWNVCTVVIDSLTYLIDLWIDDFVQHAERTNPGWVKRVKKEGGEILGPKEWGLLNMFLRSPRVKLGSCGLNVIWTCLQKDVYESQGQGKESTLDASLPMITGATKVKLPGSCKLWIHAEPTKVPMPGTMGRMMIQPTYWTSSSSKVALRHKYYNRFPEGRLNDPEWGAYPTFRALWCALHEYIYTGAPK